MTGKDFALYYTIAGFIAITTWVIRGYLKKHNTEGDMLTVLGIMFFPWVYFIFLLFKYLKILYNKLNNE